MGANQKATVPLGIYFGIQAFPSPRQASPVLVFASGFVLNAAIVLHSFVQPSGDTTSRRLTRGVGVVGMIVMGM